jgi:hypothetical protein
MSAPISRGALFTHKHWLSLDDTPAVCQITCVRKGKVFYKRVSAGVENWRAYKGADLLLKFVELGACRVEDFGEVAR